MGLLYQFPGEVERPSPDGRLRLATYGLPGLFWAYLIAAWATLACLVLAAREPLETMRAGEDTLNRALALAVWVLLAAIWLFSLACFFYQKEIEKRAGWLRVTHRLFGLPLWRQEYLLRAADALSVTHQLDSPNVARLNRTELGGAFENRGFYRLMMHTQAGKSLPLDRHSQASELRKLRTLLCRH